MHSPTRRRSREPDPLVAARLQSITYADPYVFVHASDVLDAEPDDDLGPDPGPGRAAPARAEPPLPGPLWWESLRDRLTFRRGGLLGLLVLGVGCIAAALLVLWRAQPTAASPAPMTPLHTRTASGPAPLVTSPAPKTSSSLLVDVIGKVRHPGVVRVAAGARVLDAVRAAGGVAKGASLDSVNLAAPLTDGQQVAVGVPVAAQPVVTGAVTGAGGATSAGPVDLNTAGLAELQSLPGIGPVLAQHILDYRSAHGSFASVDELQQVGGIGPSKFQQLAPHVSVGGAR